MVNLWSIKCTTIFSSRKLSHSKELLATLEHLYFDMEINYIAGFILEISSSNLMSGLKMAKYLARGKNDERVKMVSISKLR